MENNKRREILERLKDTCQIPNADAEEQLQIIKEQEEEIRNTKALIKLNYNNLNLNC